mmetsp:Transcript_321/g.450  ORF Transcript_321/g.450 Transcript_321/m.450 type:complete len:132 (-) Transcript_321:3-398(-)
MYNRVEISGNQISFSERYLFVSSRDETQRRAKLTTTLHFFQGKEKNKLFCNYFGSMIILDKSDFVNQILFDHQHGYRMRFTRVKKAPVPVRKNIPLNLLENQKTSSKATFSEQSTEKNQNNLEILNKKNFK